MESNAETVINPSEHHGEESFKLNMVGYLSNFEVYEFLKEIKEVSNKNEGKPLKHNSHLSTVVYEALQYFKHTPCIVQSKDGISQFIRRIKPYGLTKLEQLSMINTRPSMPVDIQALIEESEERLTEEQVDEIIRIVDDCLPLNPELTQEKTATDE